MANFDNYEARFILVALKLEYATQAELNALTSTIRRLVSAHTVLGKIADTSLLNRQIIKAIDKFYVTFVENLEIHAGAIGQAGAEQALDEIAPLLAKAGLYGEAVALLKETKNYSRDVQKRLMHDGWSGRTLGYRMKTLNEGTQKTVQNIIVNGTAENKGAREIAKDLEQYINPSVDKGGKIAPLDEYRQRFGKPKSYSVPGIPKGSVQYNAYRIARTEMAHVYQQATTDFYDERDWVKGYVWKLSPDHPFPDVCDDYAAVKLYETSDDLPHRHPNCLCRVRPAIMSINEMKALRYNYNSGGDVGNPYRNKGKFSSKDQADYLIQKRLNERPSNLRAIEQSTKVLSDAERLKLAKGDVGQAGGMLDKEAHDAMLAKFRAKASGK